MASDYEQPLPLEWQRVGEDAGIKKGPSFILCGITVGPASCPTRTLQGQLQARTITSFLGLGTAPQWVFLSNIGCGLVEGDGGHIPDGRVPTEDPKQPRKSKIELGGVV
jgi:hypothetical protein